MLDARFSHLYFCQSLPTPQRCLSAIADLLVLFMIPLSRGVELESGVPHTPVLSFEGD